MGNLVEHLSKGDRPISLSRYKTAAELKQAVARNFILVEFTDTEGGTELGFKIDKDKSKIDVDTSNNMLLLVGKLNLDSQAVECRVDIDPEKLTGTGILHLL